HVGQAWRVPQVAAVLLQVLQPEIPPVAARCPRAGGEGEEEVAGGLGLTADQTLARQQNAPHKRGVLFGMPVVRRHSVSAPGRRRHGLCLSSRSTSSTRRRLSRFWCTATP